MPNGTTRSYTLRERAQNGSVSSEVVCVIPATRAAAEMMHRHFGVDRAGAPSGGGGEVGTLDYELEPIVVDGGNHCSNPDWTRGEDGVCRSSRGAGGTGGEGTGGGDGSGGGGGSPPPGGGGGTCDPSVVVGGCEGDGGSAYVSDGLAYGVDCPEYICPPEEPDSIQKSKYLAVSKKIDQNKCPALYSAAVDRYPSFKVWEAEYRVNANTGDPDPNGVLVAGRYGPASEWISLWKGGFSRSDFPIILAHEAAHRLSHISGYGWDEKQTHQYALSCLLP